MLFVVFRIYILYLFLNFIFCHGDLRSLLYLIPVSFLLWLLQNLNYYFSFFMLGTYNAFKDLFDFKLIKGTPHIAFSLHSLSLGYPQDSLEAFVNKYRSVERVYVYYSFYSKGIKILSIIMFSIQIISWFVISYKISTFIFVYNTIPAILTIGSRQIPKIINKPYSTQAHAVHKFAEPFLEKKTQVMLLRETI